MAESGKIEQEGVVLQGLLAPGFLLHNRYRIDAFLEVKRDANIYRAVDEFTNLTVIVKEKMHAQDSKRSVSVDVTDRKGEILESNPWYDEFAILRSVSYPTVVKAVDIFHETERSYLIIEQLEGKDLGYFLAKQKVIVQQSCDWMIQLCQSISQIHRRRIAHLDLQPRYVIVTPDMERVRLTGFDRARQLPLIAPLEEFITGYCAPELIDGTMWDVDERADIYSLGIIWYQLITGFDPTKSKTTSTKSSFPELTYFFPNIHPELNRIIKRMMQYDYNVRFSSIEDVKRAILELLNAAPLISAFCTDVGIVREANEDSFFVHDLELVTQTQKDKFGIYIVADGMGGAEAGEYASALAIKESSAVIIKAINQAKEIGEDINFAEVLDSAIKKANAVIYHTAKRNPAYSGMGTTITATIINKGQIYIGHVGDSRAYLIAGDTIERVSRDHSLVERLLELGKITPKEAAVHPQRNLIYRSLGAYPTVEVETYQRPMKHEDSVVLCSDGLVEHIEDEEIQRIVSESGNPWNVCFKLVNMANIKGGEDNITVIVVKRQPIEV